MRNDIAPVKKPEGSPLGEAGSRDGVSAVL